MTPEILFNTIILILLFNYLLDLFLEYLNIQNYSPELPPALEGVYDDEKYRKARAYDLTKTRFGFVTSTFSIILMLAMLFFDGFAWVDSFVRTFFTAPIPVAIAFFGLLAMGSDLLGMPFSLYSTFVIEEKFGFNKTPVKTFIIDN